MARVKELVFPPGVAKFTASDFQEFDQRLEELIRRYGSNARVLDPEAVRVRSLTAANAAERVRFTLRVTPDGSDAIVTKITDRRWTSFARDFDESEQDVQVNRVSDRPVCLSTTTGPITSIDVIYFQE